MGGRGGGTVTGQWGQGGRKGGGGGGTGSRRLLLSPDQMERSPISCVYVADVNIYYYSYTDTHTHTRAHSHTRTLTHSLTHTRAHTHTHTHISLSLPRTCSPPGPALVHTARPPDGSTERSNGIGYAMMTGLLSAIVGLYRSVASPSLPSLKARVWTSGASAIMGTHARAPAAHPGSRRGPVTSAVTAVNTASMGRANFAEGVRELCLQTCVKLCRSEFWWLRLADSNTSAMATSDSSQHFQVVHGAVSLRISLTPEWQSRPFTHAVVRPFLKRYNARCKANERKANERKANERKANERKAKGTESAVVTLGEGAKSAVATPGEGAETTATAAETTVSHSALSPLSEDAITAIIVDGSTVTPSAAERAPVTTIAPIGTTRVELIFGPPPPTQMVLRVRTAETSVRITLDRGYKSHSPAHMPQTAVSPDGRSSSHPLHNTGFVFSPPHTTPDSFFCFFLIHPPPPR